MPNIRNKTHPKFSTYQPSAGERINISLRHVTNKKTLAHRSNMISYMEACHPESTTSAYSDAEAPAPVSMQLPVHSTQPSLLKNLKQTMRSEQSKKPPLSEHKGTSDSVEDVDSQHQVQLPVSDVLDSVKSGCSEQIISQDTSLFTQNIPTSETSVSTATPILGSSNVSVSLPERPTQSDLQSTSDVMTTLSVGSTGKIHITPLGTSSMNSSMTSLLKQGSFSLTTLPPATAQILRLDDALATKICDHYVQTLSFSQFLPPYLLDISSVVKSSDPKLNFVFIPVPTVRFRTYRNRGYRVIQNFPGHTKVRLCFLSI